MLEGDAELFGKVFTLFDGAAVVGFAFDELLRDGGEGVFEGCDGSGGAFADVGLIGVAAADGERGFGFEAARKTRARPAFTRSVNASPWMVMENASPVVLVRVVRSARISAMWRSVSCAVSPSDLMRQRM